jgi:pimeloyl-ACP methyl ester carboxylesterase
MSWPDARRLRWTPTLRVPSDDGTQIAVEILGDGHPGPTVVFVHGWTFSSRSYHYQRMLAERHRLVLMDHRGHGESDLGPRENRTVDQIGRDLKAVIEATCADRDVVLVGHSMGGMTIMSLAAQHPELFGAASNQGGVKAVALVNTSAAYVDDEVFGLPRPLAKAFTRQFQSAMALSVSDPEAAEKKKRAGTRGSLLVSRWLNFGKKPDKRLVGFTEAMSAQTKSEVVGDFSLSLQTHDKLAALETLGKVPTLVITGELDRLLPPKHARVIAAAVAGAKLVELRGAGHCTMLEQPETVNAALLDLIAEASAAPATAYPSPPQTRSRARKSAQKVAS